LGNVLEGRGKERKKKGDERENDSGGGRLASLCKGDYFSFVSGKLFEGGVDQKKKENGLNKKILSAKKREKTCAGGEKNTREGLVREPGIS